MQVLSGMDVASTTLKMVQAAKKQLVLVSPYFRPWDQLNRAIVTAAEVRKVPTILVVRGGADFEKQRAAVEAVHRAGVKVLLMERLHAKVYVCELGALVTSLNLLESSAVDSYEMGIWLQAGVDAAALDQVNQHVRRLVELAGADSLRARNAAMRDEGGVPQRTPVTRKIAPIAAMPSRVTRPVKPPTKAARGYCIRCRSRIKLDPNRPLCAKDFKSWSQWQDPNYTEKYCHGCGREHSTSAGKPQCRSCWQASQ